MNKQYLNDLIKYRIGQSKQTLNEANILFENKAFRGSVNRSYYAMFYSLLALLSTKSLSTSKHSGAINLFDKEFVKTGMFSKHMSEILRKGFANRQTGDYDEMIEINEEVSQQMLINASNFVDESKGLFRKV